MKSSFLLLVLIFFSKLLLAQGLNCGTPSPTKEQGETMINSIKEFQKNNKSSRVNAINTVSVPIKIHIVLQDNGNGNLSSLTINGIFSNLNFWFANMGLSFYQYGSIDYIYSNDYYNFNNIDESPIMNKYAVNNAINMFFVGNFPDRGEKVVGYANFPIGTCCPSSQSYSNQTSNAVFISTSNSPMIYQVERTIPHEMGHYFGLLHTHDTTFGNELVNGSNCSTAGDQICDTPADPYSDGYEICVKKDTWGNCYWNCTNTDRNGNRYSPQLNNVMSYYHGCGGLITSGQFTRMIWGYNVRINPNPDLYSRYYIDGLLRFNYQANKTSYCAGSTMDLIFWQFGDFSSNNSFKIQISNNNGSSYSDLSTVRGNKNNLSTTIPSNLTQGNYKMRVVSTNPYLEAGTVDISVLSTPTAIISNNSEIFQTQTSDLKVYFTGSSPWSFKLSDGSQITNTSENPYTFKVIPNTTTSYTISSLSNQCGNGTFGGFANVTVKPLTIVTGDITPNEICAESTINVPFQVNFPFPSASTYTVQLSDKEGNNFVNIPTQGAISPLKATIPNNLITSKNYKVRVITSNPSITGEFNKPFIINSKPIINISKEDKPENFILKSNSQIGNQWLFEGKEILNATDSLHIPEKIGNYFVRVTKGGCIVNSNNSISIKIDKPTIETEGENPFCENSSIKLKAPKGFGIYRWVMAKDTLKNTESELSLQNSGSFQVLVGRGKILSPLSDSLKISPKPLPQKPIISVDGINLKSSSLANNQWFANGNILKDSTNQYLHFSGFGSYLVKVTELGCSSESIPFMITASEPNEMYFPIKLYPNPNDGTFWVELPQTLKTWQVEIYDIQGKQIFSRFHSDYSTSKELIELKTVIAPYILRITTEKATQSVKFIIE